LRVNAFSTDRLELLRRAIQDRIGPTRYRTWFGDTTEFTVHEGGLDIVVPSAFAGQWIAKNYMDELVAATQSVVGSSVPAEVRIVQRTAQPALPSSNGNGARRPEVASRRGHAAGNALRGDLDAFVVGPSNRLAHAAAVSIVQTVGRAFKLLVLHGGCGLGKTHLLHGVCNGLLRAHPTVEWKYVSGEEFTNEYIAAVRSGPIDAFRARYRRVDVLVVDDLHFLANKKATQDEFLHTFNAIDAAGKAVVVTSDRHPRSIATLSDPLMNRLIAGMVIQIDPPDAATRLEILRRRAATLGLAVPDAVLEYIAERITRNVRELEGALYTLNALAQLTHERITLELARRALDEAIIRTRRTPEPSQIERVVAARFDVTREQLQSRSRDRTVVLARGIAMLLARRHTSMSFPEIGRAMGRKNHSTVLMATQRVERMLRDDAAVTWKTSHGEHRAALRGLIESVEGEVLAGTK
jgi:chromosomal replication initiator protein